MKKLLLMICLAPVLVFAQGTDPYPNRPIRIMGGGVGSTADYLSRFIGQKLNEKWAQPVVVDSRSGAGGTLSADVVAKAAPDGYNLVMGHAGPMVSAVALYKDLPYDPVKDFAPVSRMTTGVVVLVTHPSIPVSNTKELIAYLKQKSGVSYASAGNGSMSHLAGELFNRIAGVNVLHVPYKSAGFALTALLSSETQISFLSPVTAHTQLKAGRVKALAVFSAKLAVAPELITGVCGHARNSECGGSRHTGYGRTTVVRFVHHRKNATCGGYEIESTDHRSVEPARRKSNVACARCRGSALDTGGAGRFCEERASALGADYQGRRN